MAVPPTPKYSLKRSARDALASMSAFSSLRRLGNDRSAIFNFILLERAKFKFICPRLYKIQNNHYSSIVVCLESKQMRGFLVRSCQ